MRGLCYAKRSGLRPTPQVRNTLRTKGSTKLEDLHTVPRYTYHPATLSHYDKYQSCGNSTHDYHWTEGEEYDTAHCCEANENDDTDWYVCGTLEDEWNAAQSIVVEEAAMTEIGEDDLTCYTYGD